MNNLVPIEMEGQRVLSTKQLADRFETDSKQITRNFERNKDRYQEGKHYFALTGQALVDFKGSRQNDDTLKFVSVLYLWTERGCFYHAKSLGTDRAWEVYDQLVETYFKVRELVKPQSIEDLIILQAESMKEVKRQLALTREEVATTRETIKNVKDTLLMKDDNWRRDIQTMVNKVSKNSMMNFQETKSESYRLLEMRAHCNLNVRVKNMKQRLEETGSTKTQINKVCKLDAIESDPRLKEIYSSIVKEMVIKFVA
ncbi:ORF6N domain-containing protein [Marinisporobacter balticus]|uniref:ORF6N domain-containing protein n=1 Tax=Marinisporobacter balticus TaxID=2018667 RepID=A0A4R2KX08_9FIRM|nr:ORF6N domain-containing protein [Marinisporobacter balticus]TCO79101.1 ORF6N domain-containing protein [Marinisporobacter balticus]